MLKAVIIQRSPCFKVQVRTEVPLGALRYLWADNNMNQGFVTIGGLVSGCLHKCFQQSSFWKPLWAECWAGGSVFTVVVF